MLETYTHYIFYIRSFIETITLYFVLFEACWKSIHTIFFTLNDVGKKFRVTNPPLFVSHKRLDYHFPPLFVSHKQNNCIQSPLFVSHKRLYYHFPMLFLSHKQNNCIQSPLFVSHKQLDYLPHFSRTNKKNTALKIKF